MSLSLLLVLLAGVVVLVALVVIVTSRRSADGVDSFRRQIDALSPEARRTVVDQVQNAAGRPADDQGTDDPDGPDGPDDEDGVRGT